MEQCVGQSKEHESADNDLPQNPVGSDDSVAARPITSNKEQLPIDCNTNSSEPQQQQQQQLLLSHRWAKSLLNPFLDPSPVEKSAYAYLFSLADNDSPKVIPGERAVVFFAQTEVPAHILGEMWHLTDPENRGLLTKVGFYIMLKLLGRYQHGHHKPTTDLAFKSAPLPMFEGITIPAAALSTTIASSALREYDTFLKRTGPA